MTRLIQQCVKFLKREDGPTAVECAVMLALVLVMCIVAIHSATPSGLNASEPSVVIESPNK